MTSWLCMGITIEGQQSACPRALQMLKELNATGRRKLPEDAPTEFLPQRLKPIVINHGEIDRRAWECALLIKLRDEVKAGYLSVRYRAGACPPGPPRNWTRRNKTAWLTSDPGWQRTCAA
jgi:hypothetical protein